MISLTTALSRAECDERIQARIDRRAIAFRIDPARPVSGRSSIEGFTLRRPRDPIVEAVGTYLLGSQGGTRIDVRYVVPWRAQAWWMSLNAAILGPIGGVLLVAARPVRGDPTVAALVGIAIVTALVLVLEIAIVAIGWLVYGPGQRAYLRRVIEETLAAR